MSVRLELQCATKRKTNWKVQYRLKVGGVAPANGYVGSISVLYKSRPVSWKLEVDSESHTF